MSKPDLIERYRKVRSLAERGGTEGEATAARNVLEGMERDHPGLGAAVLAADEAAREGPRRRASPPPPPNPAWSVHEAPPPPPPRPGFVPGHDPYASPYAPPGHSPVRVDPDAYNGNPWRARPPRVVVVSRSRWEEPEPHSPFGEDGTLPAGYGDAARCTAGAAWRRR